MDDYPYSMNFNTTRRGLVILVPAIFALTGCAQDADSGFSGDASSINEISHSLWTYSWLAAAVVGVFTAILIVWPAIFHRARGAGKFRLVFRIRSALRSYLVELREGHRRNHHCHHQELPSRIEPRSTFQP